jgi:hypothetical protein
MQLHGGPGRGSRVQHDHQYGEKLFHWHEITVCSRTGK